MAKARKRSSPLISALEPRMLLDGAALTEAAQAITDTELQNTPPEPAQPADTPARDTTVAEFEPVFALSDQPQGQIIVVDASVPFGDELLADVPADWVVIRLDANSDGLDQLNQALDGQTGLTAIHIFTHGSNAQMQLGATTLTTDNLSSRQADLQRLGTFLSAGGDLMLYGCDVALDFVGQSFVSQLAALTGADVAASDDATGNVVAGGDWELEYSIGQIDAQALSSSTYDDTLGTINMATGLASGSGSINIARNAPRLYWQASGPDGYDPNGTDAEWVDQYTADQKVSYWSSAWGSYSYPVPRWGWLPWTMRTVWYQYPVVADWNYGSGTRYGVETVQLEKTSDYRFDVTTNVTYKDRNGQVLTNSGSTAINTALYKGTFDPTNPMKNLVTASQGGGWASNQGGALKLGELEAGTYQVVVSFDTNRWFVGVDNNVWWSNVNNYAQQMWGNFTLNVTNLNQAPVWTARDLTQLISGSDTQSFAIPWSLAGNQTLVDPDGDALTVTATLANGSALPSWLTFNPNNLSFTGNPPANTGTLNIRLSATDGQLTSTRDFSVTYSNDNDQPVVAEIIPDQTWDGSGSFSYTFSNTTFTDADPGTDTFTYSATLGNGDPLPSWLSFDATTRTFSGNPPANFASLDVKVTANDGTGQANATQSDTFTLNLRNNNDVPTVTSMAKAIGEDSTYSFSAADFAFTDTDTHATNDTTSGSGKTIQSVRIVSLPANGTLWLDADNDNVFDDGEAVLVNQSISAASLGLLRYTPKKDWAGATGLDRSNTPDSFEWTATDGVTEAAAPATTTITVNLINDAPLLGFSDGRTLSVRPNTGNTLSAVKVDPGLTLSDVDALYTSDAAYDTISKVTVSITEKVSGNFISGDTLAVTAATASANGITVSYNSATGVLTLSGNARADQYQAVLRTLEFSSSNTGNDNIREVAMQLQAADVGTLSYAVFDGVDDYIDTMEASLPVGGDFTVSVWAQIASDVANGNYTLLAQGNTVDNFFIMLAKQNGDWRIRLGDSWHIVNGFPSDGKWHQYTVTRSGTVGTLYIDGIKVGTGTMEAALPGTSLRIGGLYRQNDLQEWGPAFWKGGISDARVYNRVITTDEISRSLDRDAGLKGYEPNLVAWYPLANDFQNKAADFSWSLGRDFNPLNGDGTDGPWSVGVITGNPANSGNFSWGAFQPYTQTNSAWTMQTDPRGSARDFIQLDHKDAGVGNATTGWARFMFPNGFDNVSSFTFTPGAVGMLPGHVNPAAMQFTAPVAGVYAVDARFWDANGGDAPSKPSYKVFKVNAAGTSGVEISPGPVQVEHNSLPQAASARSAVQQVVLAAGERLVFAVHKGDGGGLNGDETQAAIDVNLIATAVQAGGQTWYYNHATGHYIGLSSTTATWANAQTAAGAINVGGQTGYLTTATDPNSLNIFRALMRDAGVTSVFAGGYQLASATDNATTGYRDGWFWSTGPRDGELFDGPWLPGEPNSSSQDALAIHAPSSNYHLAGYDDGTASSSYRYLIELGDSPLAPPAELAAALSALVDSGNALVFVDATTAYSAATGHYYKLATSSGDFAAQQQAAANTTVAGNTGYLAQATTPDELALVTRLARLNNSSGVWVGLRNVDTNGAGAMDWKWVNANGSVAGNLDSSQIYQTAETIHPLETAGWTRVAYDSFEHGNTGWRYTTTNNPVSLWNGQFMGRTDDSADPSVPVRKAFDINNKATVITFRFNRYDTWDNEIFAISVLGETNAKYALFQETLGSVLVTTPVSKTVNGVKYTFTPLPNYGNFYGNSANDQSFEVQIELPTNFGDTLTVTIDTNLDQRAYDETYGVDNFALWQKNVPTNPGVGGTFEDFEGGVLTGWDNDFGNSANFDSTVTVNRGDGVNTTALWFSAWRPQKTFHIDNEATRVEFDFYALDSWDWEYFYTYINDVAFNFQRVLTFNYTDVVTGSMVVNGKPVTWSITPNNDYRNWSGTPGGWNDQSFRVVIDLPKNFGESFELKFATSLDSAVSDESAAIDNVRVYSRENAGWVDPYTGVLQSDATALPDSTSNFVLNGQAGDYLDLGTISGLSGAYTLEGWVYADAANTWGRIFDLGNGQQSNNIFLGFSGDTGKIELSNYVGATKTAIITNNTLPLGQWVHVAAVNNGNGTGAIYFNGELQATTGSLSGGAAVDRTNSYAGRSNWAVDDYFRGQLNQLRIWNDARTQAEINAGRGTAPTQNVLSNADLTDSNLMGFWHRSQLDGTGLVNDLSTKNQDAWLNQIDNIVRLDQFASINLWHTTNNRWFNDNDWDPTALSTDGRNIYAYYGWNNWMFVFDMNGRAVTDYAVNSALGGNTAQMAYSHGWLYVRNANVTSTATDDSIRRVSTADGSFTNVTLDASKPLLNGQGWAYGSLFNMPDGRLGIVSTPDGNGNITVRLYNLADNGTRLVWDRDFAANIGAGWWNNNHGATSDGRYLYLLRREGNYNYDYKVVDLFTGEVALDGSQYNLYQQAVDNPTLLTIDPLTGDIYFADNLGSHIARASKANGATREAVYEFGANGVTLTAPLLTTQANVAKPDVFVTDTRDIQVRVGNTAPTVSNWSAAAVLEDGTLNLTASQFNDRFTDPELDSLYSITLQSVPTAAQGTLSLNGTALAASAVVFAGDLDKLVFIPAANFNGSASFSYTASDGYLSSGTATVSLTVTAVNDAPVIDTAATPALTAIDEDLADASNTGTLVSDLVANGSITDPDVGTAPEAIAVTKVDNTHGVWQYRIGAGAWTAFSATTGQMVDLGSAALLLDATDSIRFVPGANVNSTANGSPSISFRAWDKSAGTAGGTTNPNATGGNTAVSSATDTASLTIHAVNDVPTTASKTVSMDEDTTYTFATADFAFSDVDVADSLQSVKITTLPLVGSLWLDVDADGVLDAGEAVTLNQEIAVAAITAQQLKYTPAPDGFGASYAQIGFAVGDGTTFSAPQTLTFSVTDTNDAPTAAAWASGGTVAENSATGTVVGKLSATDPNTGDTFTFVRAANPNFNIAPDGTVTVAPNAIIDFERTPTQTLRVQVKDSGGLTYEQDLTVTLTDVVEDAPSLIVNPVYVDKGATVTITQNQLKATDSVQTSTQLVYTVLSAPSGGTWWVDSNNNGLVDGSEAALGPVNEGNPNGIATFTHADVVGGKLKFKQDGTQANSVLQLSLSDGTAASVDADGNPLVTGTLAAIVSSPPVVSPVDDQQWRISGAQTFTLPAGTFTDPDYDNVSVTAQIWDAAANSGVGAWVALPSWLSFNDETLTFSGTPTAYSNDQYIDIRISGTDNKAGAGRPVTDEFRITFKNAITQPAVTNPIESQTDSDGADGVTVDSSGVRFDGAGSKSFTFAADTFTADASHPITGYTATLSNGSALPTWLQFDSATRTFSGNPPASAAPGPYWIKLSADTAVGGSASVTFKLIVTNANDAPIEASPGVHIPDRVIADANDHVWTIAAGAFTDGDGDTLTLRAGDVNGNELPSWVRFDPSTRSFTAKAPSGSGTLTVRLFADDGQGESGYADFTITYSGGVNEAPSVMTPDGIYAMDDRGDLNLADTQKAERFSLAHGQTATITKDHLKELDADDDGAALTYTVTTLPRHGQLWLDTDGDGTINGAEVALRAGATFTQADIDNGQLKYRNTYPVPADNDPAIDPPDDRFVFNLADDESPTPAKVTGATFSIEVTPKPAAPTLLSVLRSSSTTAVISGGVTSYVTNDDSLTFKLVFSENVRGVDASDFALTGNLKDFAQITGISPVNASTYTITVGSKTGTSGIASANGTLGLELATTPTIKNTAQTVSLSTAILQATVNNEVYTLDNTGPTATLSAQPLHDGATAFWVTIDFGTDAISDLTLDDLVVSHSTASQLQRISTDSDVDPSTQPEGFNPLTDTAPTPEGNRYRVLITPTSGTSNDITVELVAAGVTNSAGNGNASASVTIDRNSLPTLVLDAAAATPVADRSATFTEVNGADDGSAAVAFVSAGTSLADVDASQNLAWLNVAFTAAQIADGDAETLRVQGATAGGSIALNLADGAAVANVTLEGVAYSVTASEASGARSLRFAKADGTLLTLAQAETLLDALRYNNSSDTPTTTANRVFSVTVHDGLETSAAATFTVTVAATNDSPLITVGTLDSATASLSETNAGLRASGTLSIQDLDASQTVAISKVGVTESGTGPAGSRPSNGDLLAMLTINNGATTPGSTIIDSTATTGTAYWAFNSGSTSFDYLAAGETLVLTYTVRATDSGSTPATDDQTITVTITGTNDAPRITASTASAINNTGTTVTASGAVGFTDPDSNDTPVAGFAKLTDTSYTASRALDSTAFNLNAAAITALQNALTVTAGTGAWTYALDTTLLKDSGGDTLILSGDKVVVTYNVNVSDGKGGSTAQDLKFTLIGTGTGATLVVSGDAGAIVEGAPSTLSDAGSFSVDGQTITSALLSSTVNYQYTNLTLDASTTPTAADFEAKLKAGLTLSVANGFVNWNYALVESDLDFLPGNAIVQATFSVEVNGGPGHGGAAQNLTIVINGTNDAPIITSAPAAAEGSVVEAGSGVTGTNTTAAKTLTASDVDAGAVLTWSVTGYSADASLTGYTHSKLGTYGRLYLNAQTGAWTYVLDNADANTQALEAGESVVETFAANVSDGTASATQQIRVTVTGSNDAPVLTAPGTIATYADTAAYDTFSGTGNPTGSLSASDAEGDNLTYAITGQDADNTLTNFTHSVTGSYGKLYLNALTGAYQYVRNTAQMNAATTSVTDDFTLQVTDALGVVSNTATLTVAVTGVNDNPTLAPRARSGTSTFYLDETDSGLTVSNILAAGEVDASQTLTVSVPTATVQLNSAAAQSMSVTEKGWLTLTPGTASGTTLPIDWTFNSGSEAFNQLEPGDTLTFVYTVRVSDGVLSAESLITVVVEGTNDAPVISLSSGDSAQAALTETNADGLTATDTLSVSDAEAANTLTATVAGVTVHSSSTADSAAIPAPSDLLTMMVVSPTTAGGTVRGTNALTWTFNSGDQTFNALADGETLVIDYTVRVSDNDNGMSTQTVRVTVTGSNDLPVISHSAVTSGKSVDGSDDSIPDALQGFISSGLPDKLFDSGTLNFTDLDVSDRPLATVTGTQVTGALRGAATGSLMLSAGQQADIINAFSLTPSSSNAHNGQIQWNYNINQTAIDFLGSGETVTAVFTVTLNDGYGGTASEDITITLAGKNNAPIISIESGDSDAEVLAETNAALTISDTLTVTDTNLTDTVTAQVLSGTVQSNNDTSVALTSSNGLNWLTLNASTVLSGSSRTAAAGQLTWTFNSGAQTFDDLAVGETRVYTYTIRVSDDAPGSVLTDDQTVSITITGTNDTPVISLGADDGKTATLDETNAGLKASDSLTVTDLDTTNSVTVSRTLSASGNTSDPAAPSSAQLLAMLQLSANNSNWTNGPLTLIGSSATTAPLYWQFDSGSEAFNYLSAGESLVLTYTVTATDNDGTPLSDTEMITVTINGSNDAPVISDGPDAEDLTESNSGLSTLGSLTVRDVDTSDVVTATRTLAVSGSSNRSDPAAPSDATLLAMFNVSASTVLSGTQNSATLNWNFDSGSQAFDYLAEGQTLVLTYTVTATDDSGTPLSDSDSETVTLTITGSNDAPVISLLSQDSDSAALTETNAALTAEGTLSVSDVDRADTVSPSVVQVVATGTTTGLQSDNAALLAMLSVDSNTIVGSTVTSGTLNWRFDSRSEHFNHLADGEQLTLSYTVRASDSSAGQADHMVTITVTGSNDTPTVSISTPAVFVEAANASAQALSATGSVDFVELDRSDLLDVSFQMAQPPVWSGGPLPSALAQSLASGFSVAANNVSVTTPVNWSYSHAATDLDFLGADETITFSYVVTVTDALGQTASAPVEFTIAGSNDSPQLQSVSAIHLTDTADDDSPASVAGSLLSSDLDALDSATFSVGNGLSDSSRSGYDLKVAGTYGTLYLNSGTGAYEYLPDAQAINALTANAGENFTLTVTDRVGATASQVLAVNIQAANDTPTLTASPDSTSFIDNPGDDNFVPVTGQLSGSDRDAGSSLSYSLQGTASVSTLSGYDLSMSGRFGTLHLNSTTGAYTYVPNDAAIEGQSAGTTAQDDFVFEVSDGSLSQTTGFTVTIVGAGDPPVWSDGDDSVVLAESNSTLTASGNLTLTDNDLSDAVSLSKTVAVSTSTPVPLPDTATLLGMLDISPTSLLDDATSTSASVSWVFNSGSEYFNNLPAGETLTLIYTITATDTGSPGLTGTTTVTVTITGTNDGPVLAAPATITLTDTAGDDSLGSVTGQLIASDVDHNTTLVYSLASQVSDNGLSGYDRSQSGRFGKLYLNSSTGAYLYVPDEAAIEALKADEREAFSVRVSDGSASTTQSLNIDITAVNDTPVLGAITAISLTDTAVNNSFADVTGHLTAIDRDGDVVQFGVTGQVAGTQVIGTTVYNASKVGTYGTLYLNVDSGAYRYVVDSAATQALKTDASEVFSLLASDGSASAAGLLTVNITAENDTPSLSASVTTIELTDTVNEDRFASTTGVLTSSDRDAPDTAVYGITGGSSDTSRSGYNLKKTGAYGTLFVSSSTGAYEFVPEPVAINALSAHASENFTLTLVDGSGATDSQLLSINVNAVNDRPELTTNLPSTTYVDTASSDTYSAVIGSLSGTDRDTGAVLTYAIDSGVSESHTVGGVTYDLKRVGTHGTLFLQSTNGAYTYVPDDTAINNLSQNTQDAFTLTVSDGTLSQSTGFTVWLVGASDQPVISDGQDRVALTESNAALSASGSITVIDSDLSDSVNLTRTVDVGGSSTGTPPSEADLLSMFSLNTVTVLGDGSSIMAPVTWNFNGDGTHFDYLAEGETLVLTYSIIATDTGSPALSDSTTVIVTITGTNDAPVLTLPTAINLTDTAADDSLTPVTGSLQGSDADHNAVLTYSLAGQVADASRNGFDVSRAGHFGTLFLNSVTGAYTFVPNSDAIQALKTNASEDFSVRVSDGMSTATQSLNVGVTASNDTPTLSASVTDITYDDTGIRDRFDSMGGALTSSDRDAGDSATFSIDDAQTDTSREGYTHSRTGSYGTLFLHSQTGAYLYVPNNAAINALTAPTTESFDLQVTDGSLATVSQTLTVTLNGANDVPVLTHAPAALVGTVTEAGHNDDGSVIAGTAIVSGTLTASDADVGATRSWSLQGSPSTTYGTMALNASTGVWTYTLNNSSAATQALKEGEVVTQTYTARVTDNLGASVDQTLTITIRGTNDVPVVTNAQASTVGTVVEAGHLDDGTAVAGTANVSGTLTVSDADASATRSWSLQGSPSTTYGTMALNASTGVWTYTLNNSSAATQALREGQSVTQTYTARAMDNFGAYVDQTITVTINGTNDVPVVSSSPDQALGTVRESGHFDDGSVDGGTSSVSGQVAVSDVDRAATRVYELEGEVRDRYGRIALNRDTGEWIYTLDNTLIATQNLREGQIVQQTYTVRVTDDRDAQVRETLTITIEGSNDVPVVVGALEATAYLQGEQMVVPTAQLFTDIDVGAGDFTYSAVLPPGMVIDAQTGVISGAGTRPGDYDIVIRATDAQGAWAETRWAVRINAPAQNESVMSDNSRRSGGSDLGLDTGGATTLGGATGVGGTGGLDALSGGIPGFSSTIPVPASTASAGLGGDGVTGAGTAIGSLGVPSGNALTANSSGSSAASAPATAPATASASAGAQPATSGTANATGEAGASAVASGAASTGVSESAAGTASNAGASQGSSASTPESQPQEQGRTDASVGADGQLQVSTQADAQANANNAESTQQAVERVNVAVNANGQISLRQEAPSDNETPTGIMLVEVSQQQNGLQIEIADFRRTQVSQYRATLPDGSPLPDWIRVDPATGKVSAEPGQGVQLIELRFIAEDANGGIRTLEIKIDLSGQSSAEPSTVGSSALPARPAFMHQLAAQHQQWDGYGEQLLSVFTE